MNNVKQILTTLLFCLVSSITLSAQAPTAPTISIQGTLKDAGGAAVSDGSYLVEFRLYHAPTGGTIQWDETAMVDVTGGIYSHYLGSVEDLSTSIFEEKLYLGVSVNNLELVPRTELTYAPYTFAAATVVCSGAVGDVKYSILNPTQFADVNGECWVPLDGGSMLNSELADIIGGTNVPNMSGLFIRAQEYNGNNDPDRTPTSTVAQYQADSFKSHNHTGTTNNVTSTVQLGGAHSHTVTMSKAQDDDGFGGSSDEWVVTGSTTGSVTTGGTGNHQHTMNAHNHPFTTAASGVAETRSKNMNFYIYIRIN